LYHIVAIFLSHFTRNVAKRLRCDGILHYTFIAESDGERILKVGQHLAKLWARVGCPVFWLTR